MFLSAFGPRGATVALNVTATAYAPINIPSESTVCETYQFVNAGANICYFTASARGNAAPVAAIPVDGTPANGVPILPNEIVIYTLVPDVFISAICPGGQTTTLLITPGVGM